MKKVDSVTKEYVWMMYKWAIREQITATDVAEYALANDISYMPTEDEPQTWEEWAAAWKSIQAEK